MELMETLSNSQIMKKISNTKKEIEESKQFLSNIIGNQKVPSEEIRKTKEQLIFKNALIHSLGGILLLRNYENNIIHRGTKYRPIELLKLKDKLFQNRDINDIILKADTSDSDEEMLKLSLETFQSNMECKNEINEIFDVLEEYNKTQGN